MEYIFGTGNRDLYEIIFAFSYIFVCGLYSLERFAHSLKKDELFDNRDIIKHSLGFHRWCAYLGSCTLGTAISALAFNYKIGAFFYFAGIAIIYLSYGRPEEK